MQSFCFKVSFKDASREFLLCADTEVSRQEWAMAIKEATAASRAEQAAKMQRRLAEITMELTASVETARSLKESEVRSRAEIGRLRGELEAAVRALRVSQLKKQASFTGRVYIFREKGERFLGGGRGLSCSRFKAFFPPPKEAGGKNV